MKQIFESVSQLGNQRIMINGSCLCSPGEIAEDGFSPPSGTCKSTV